MREDFRINIPLMPKKYNKNIIVSNVTSRVKLHRGNTKKQSQALTKLKKSTPSC